MSQFDLIWARMVRVISFVGGFGIMIYEAGWDHQDRPWLYAAAVGMMGLPVARAAEQLLGRFSSSSAPIDTPRKPE